MSHSPPGLGLFVGWCQFPVGGQVLAGYTCAVVHASWGKFGRKLFLRH